MSREQEERAVVVMRGHRFPIDTGAAPGPFRFCHNLCLCQMLQDKLLGFLCEVDPSANCPNDGIAPIRAPFIQEVVRAGDLRKSIEARCTPIIAGMMARTLLEDSRLYRALQLAWIQMRPEEPIPGTIGGHIYPGVFRGDFLFTSDCANLCGCSMGSYSAHTPGHARATPKDAGQPLAGAIRTDAAIVATGYDALDPSGACPYSGIALWNNPVIAALSASDRRNWSKMSAREIETLSNRWDVRWAITYRKRMRMLDEYEGPSKIN